MQELLEGLGGDQLLEETDAVVGRERGTVPGGLHPLLQPLALRLLADAQVLDAERPRVRLLQGGHEIPQRGSTEAPERRAVDDPIQVRLAQAELAQLQQGVPAGRGIEGIDPGHEMTKLAVGVNQIGDGRGRPGRRRPRAARPRELVAREHEGPALVDRPGGLPVLAVQGLDVFGIGAGDEIEPAHDH